MSVIPTGVDLPITNFFFLFQFGCTLLHEAVKGGRMSSVALLISRGLDVNAVDKVSNIICEI